MKTNYKNSSQQKKKKKSILRRDAIFNSWNRTLGLKIIFLIGLK